MIVVINPSGGAGRSFKGLHTYCSHDVDAKTNERVEWTETRNLGTDNPDLAWKLMARTAQNQNQIKQDAGIKPGPAPKDGPVLHVVLSFDKDEPVDRETIKTAADEFLSQLGVDPGKMRSKNKPKRRQFADEHQVVMYTHTDTKNTHVHLMINRVHPQTGVLLPSNRDQIKAQKWALEFSKRHGTEKKTPAREQNYEARKEGDFVKGPKRKTRNQFDLDKAIAASSNDNDRVAAFIQSERTKNAAIAKRGRDLKHRHDAEWNKLVGEDKQQAIKLKTEHQSEVSKAKIANRKAYRPRFEELYREQAAERTKFDEMEKSLIGRGANMLKAYGLAANDPDLSKTTALGRALKVVTGTKGREEVFDRAQAQERSTLKREQSDSLAEDIGKLKTSYADKCAAKDKTFVDSSAKLISKHRSEIADLKTAWKERKADRSEALYALSINSGQNRLTANVGLKQDYIDDLLLRLKMREEMSKTPEHAQEQDNARDKDGHDPT